MKKTMLAAALGLVMVGGSALAQTSGDSPWLLRFRATNLDMANKNGTPVAGLAVNDKAIPEVDINYFFSPNVAAELVLTVPQKQKVSTTAGGQIGTFKHLPPTLLLQYHFTQFQGFKPYVGAGVNYTKISSVNLVSPYSLEKDSWGLAVQAGVDVPLSKNWSVNFDVKKVQIRTNVFASGVSAGELKLDPTLFSVGVGYRF